MNCFYFNNICKADIFLTCFFHSLDFLEGLTKYENVFFSDYLFKYELFMGNNFLPLISQQSL